MEDLMPVLTKTKCFTLKNLGLEDSVASFDKEATFH